MEKETLKYEKVIICSEQDLPPKDKGDGEISVKTYVKCLNGDIVTARYDFKNKQWFDRHFAVIDDAVAILQPIPSPDKAEGMTKERVTLSDLEPGSIFEYEGCYGFKSEYRTAHGAIEAYCLESGEFFWGGTKRDYDQTQLLVRKVELSELSLSPRKMTEKNANKNKSVSKYRKVPIIIMQWNDGIKGWKVEIPDNYEKYKPSYYDELNFEDLSFHFQHNTQLHPHDPLLFLTRKDAVEAARYCNEKYLKGKAKIWFIH